LRSEAEMMQLILEPAETDDRIRAVIMNGSRTNPGVPCDIFQDYDIVYIVRDVAAFTTNPDWINRFGKRIVMEMPEAMALPPAEKDGHFTYLMLFADGNRIDLTLISANQTDQLMARDSLTQVLLDKDGLIAPFPPSNDRDYLPVRPTARTYADCCTEFWWVSTYVAKGLWRNEITYAKAMADGPVRAMLHQMIRWHIGIAASFTKSAGKEGKYFKNYLSPRLWQTFLSTYSDADAERSWASLFAMCRLFRELGQQIAAHFQFNYSMTTDEKVVAYLKHVHDLPRDAEEIY
jgi:Streptomycin adenylyltransferase.